MNGREIANIIRKGDKDKINQTFENIYNDYFRLLYFVGYSYLNNEQIVSDIVEDTFALFFNKCLDVKFIKKIKNVKSYLSSSVKYEAIREKKILELNDFSVNVETDISSETNDSKEIYLSNFLKILSKEEIEIIVNHIFVDRSFKDIAFEMKVSINTVKSKYRRAIIKIREELDV